MAGRLFTFGSSREVLTRNRAFTKDRALISFFDRQQHVKQRFDAYRNEDQKDWKGTFRPWILPLYND